MVGEKLNHLTWERRVLVDGVDMLPTLLSSCAEAIAANVQLPSWLLRNFGALPSYYVRYFYTHDKIVTQQRDAPSRAEEVASIEAELLRLYADPSLTEQPTLLAKRGGAYYSEVAVDVLSGLLGGAPARHVIDLRNGGTLPFLPEDSVIEVPVDVGPDGFRPVPVPAVEPAYAGLIAHVAAYEELAVEAALHGGLERVTRALIAHPLVGETDLARRLAELLVATNRNFLPWAT